MRPNFDAAHFLADTAEDFSRAHKLVSDLETLSFLHQREPGDEEVVATELELADVTKRLRTRLAVALEWCELPSARAYLEQTFAKHKDLTRLEHMHYVDVLYSPAVADLYEVFTSLASCLPPADVQAKADVERQRSLLEQVLIGTPKLIVDRKLSPENEADVRREIYGLLLHVFPDTVRELGIAGVSKTYKADIGVKSLETAIEYKFAVSAGELKTCLEGIYADMKGYSGSKDWTFFFAVIYCTDAFMTPAQLAAELSTRSLPENWRFLLVTGRGERRKKKDAAANDSKKEDAKDTDQGASKEAAKMDQAPGAG